MSLRLLTLLRARQGAFSAQQIFEMLVVDGCATTLAETYQIIDLLRRREMLEAMPITSDREAQEALAAAAAVAARLRGEHGAAINYVARFGLTQLGRIHTAASGEDPRS
jgi:anthranilate phosphoribosyltransferase